MINKYYIFFQGTYSAACLSFPCDSFSTILRWKNFSYCINSQQRKLTLFLLSRLHFLNLSRGFKLARGHVDNEDIYAAYTQIHNGRYLIVFFINKQGNSALPISARDMDNKERRYYENQKRSKKKY